MFSEFISFSTSLSAMHYECLKKLQSIKLDDLKKKNNVEGKNELYNTVEIWKKYFSDNCQIVLLDITVKMIL